MADKFPLTDRKKGDLFIIYPCQPALPGGVYVSAERKWRVKQRPNLSQRPSKATWTPSAYWCPTTSERCTPWP